MNVLLIGSGAREHALAKSLTASESKPLLYCCANSYNPGIEAICSGYWFGDICDVQTITELAKNWQINLAIIGPEAPLEQGMADALWANGIPVVGPKKKLAQIETSKAFARDLMKQFAIPGLPRYQEFNNLEHARHFLEALGEGNYVIKANGLMSGKGVKVAGDHLQSIEQAVAFCKEIFNKNQTLLIEEKLIGQEFSFMCFSDGNTLIPMPIVQDNKRAYVGDKGPNTGGMGSYSAADHRLPFLTEAETDAAFQINQQVIHALMTTTKEKYIGILYGGFIATAQGVFVIEFNARFGDPESLNVLNLLETDFLALCLAMVEGHLSAVKAKFANKATVCKYAVPWGYPDKATQDAEIDISQVQDKSKLYLAAVNQVNGRLYATGSRTAAFVGVANTVAHAEEIAEQEISKIKGPLFHRDDIGKVSLINKSIASMQALRCHD